MARPVLRTTPAQKASVGGLIVVALLILAVAIIILGGEQGFLKRKYEIKARFKRISGLQAGSPVWLSGKKVGSVSKITFVRDAGDTVFIDVSMMINGGVRDLIRSDSEARIATLGLLGDKYVGITLGHPDSAEIKPGEYVKTNNPIDFEELIGKGVETFEDLSIGGKHLVSIAAKLDSGQGTLGKLINDPDIYFDIARLADYSEKIAGRIERNEGTIGRLFNDPKLYDNIVGVVERTSSFLDTLKAGNGTIGRLVKDPGLYDHLTASLGRIDTLVARVERGEGTTGKLISDDELYNHIYNSVTTLDSLLLDIKNNPEGYFKVKVTLF
ncbi:hypothetical protein DRQ36_00315 [bacterium]|nr:MAG: hypothetical protein DRQ36_00315 [bacterium]